MNKCRGAESCLLGWHRAVWYIYTDSLEKPVGSIIRIIHLHNHSILPGWWRQQGPLKRLKASIRLQDSTFHRAFSSWSAPLGPQITLKMRELSFSQRCVWGFRSSGMLYCAVGWMALGDKDNSSAFIFKGSAIQAEYPVLRKPEKYRSYGHMRSAYLQLYRSVLYRVFQEE